MAWCTIVGSVLLYIGLGTLIGGLTYGRRSYGTDWWIAFVTTGMSATIGAWFFAVGASIGSFLNVVAYRLPLGRTVGGHSGCPYCCSPIARGDNVPVLAWLKLRGRCRTCRLPISAQYPLVEFLVAMIFLFVFATEVARGGANLPSERVFQVPIYQVAVTSTLIMRIVSYLVLLCGLVAAGLIVVKRQTVPLRLYIWSLLPVVISAASDPATVVVFWRSVKNLGPIEARLQAIATVGLGVLAGATLGWFISWILYRQSQSARAWIVGLAIVGGLVGWQAVLPVTVSMIASWLLGRYLFRRYADRLAIEDPAVWMCFGLLFFRALWRQLSFF
ncbi:MAG: prepilin peptidase [Pirellulaceae bacterium]|nr:prepilin peptidase [Pirellulaceae bacterium]